MAAVKWKFASAIFRMMPKPFVIPKLLVEGSFNLLIGRRKLGKTLVTTDLALAISSGQKEWAGHHISPRLRGGLVVYVLGEGTGRFNLRMRAWCESHNVNPRTLDKSFVLYPAALNLLEDEAVETFLTKDIPAMEAKAGKSVSLIVLDTWSRCVRGAEVDEAFNKAVTHIDDIRRETGATILALHHVPKSELPTARGSGVLEGAIDTQFLVEPVNSDKKKFTFKCQFARDFAEYKCPVKFFERRDVQFDDTVDPDTGEPEESAVLVLLDAKVEAREAHAALIDRVFECLTREWKSQAKTRDELKAKGEDIAQAFEELVNTGRIEPVGNGPKRKYRPVVVN